jgi:hypothetical protein
MQHHIAAIRLDGTQQLTRASEFQSGFLLPMRSLSLFGFDETMARSYFFQTFDWGPFWYPLICTATDRKAAAINHICSLAIVYSYMGIGVGEEALYAKGQKLYVRALQWVRSFLQHSSKKDLPHLAATLFLIAIHDVSKPFSC